MPYIHYCALGFILSILFPKSFNINGLKINSGKIAGKYRNINIMSIGKCQNDQINKELITVKILVMNITVIISQLTFYSCREYMLGKLHLIKM